MHALSNILIGHGYIILLVWVFLEQLGLPLPSTPLLLVAGALSGAGKLNVFYALAPSVTASVTADIVWYELGHRKGVKVVQWLCRISLEPDSCVRRTEGVFERQGAKSLLFAKFVPGLNVVATPLAGIFHMKFRKFLLFDSLGALLWAGTFLFGGFLFSDQLEVIAKAASTLGGWLVVLLLVALAGYVLFKFYARRKFLHELRISRISVDELKEKIDAGEEVTIVDLRHSLDFEADPETIPGALHLDSKQLSEAKPPWPPEREVVLYCT
ncbi:MAG TPA: VTT domain-containing protein [Candidatus Saccharimonadales bacterium]|nr:VTT domain-containing protein [Candidatus Saccharimonadales bacterium]